jgi:hypothetical protein
MSYITTKYANSNEKMISGVNVMEGLSKKQYEGKEIICLDISHCSAKDKEKMKEHVNAAKEVIRQYSSKSALLITDVTDTKFDAGISSIIKEYAQHNTPYVKASALVGVAGMQKVILSAVKRLTGRDYYLANTMDEAIEWLIKQ